MTTIGILVANAGLVLAMMVAVWLLSLWLRDSSIVDIAWGLGFVLVAAATFVAAEGWEPRKTLVTALTAVWGFRLALHIHLRNRGRGEDPRYAAWREEHGRSWPLRSLVTVFLLQGVLLWLISLPVQAAQLAAEPARFTWLDVAGAVLWAAGLGIETIADGQLLAFKRDARNAGRVLTTGLWRYSRHPNYFGEAVLWWGLWLIAASTVPGRWTVLGPILITWLLRRVSGVPMTERLMEGRPGYREYVERTNEFVMWRRKGG